MSIPLLVSPQWLNENLEDPSISVIESAWYGEGYLRAHIPGAVRTPYHPHLKQFDRKDVKTPYLLDKDEFATLCRRLGLRKNRHYVIYDDWHGLFAARFLWVCRYYGIHNVSILDGSWRGWLAQGRPVASRVESPEPGTDLNPTPHPEMRIDLMELLQVYQDPQIQIWDTRRKSEYSGEEKTDDLRQGHLPGALNLLWLDLLTEPDHEGGARFLRPLGEVKDMLSRSGLKRDRTVITYCESGIRAAFGIFVLTLLGYPKVRLYDASLAEWANLEGTPLYAEKGNPAAFQSFHLGT